MLVLKEKHGVFDKIKIVKNLHKNFLTLKKPQFAHSKFTVNMIYLQMYHDKSHTHLRSISIEVLPAAFEKSTENENKLIHEILCKHLNFH
jgi:hypothetical protein